MKDNNVQGISLRDQFAMWALTGYVVSNTTNALTYLEIAEKAYIQADSMLAERDKSKDSRYGKKEHI